MTLEQCIQELESEYTDNCLVITDNNLNKPGPTILWANKAMENLTGYSLSEMRGNSPRILQGEKTDRATLDRLRNSLEQGEIFEGAIINHKKDGTEFFKYWRIAPIIENDKIIFYFAVHQEITTETELKMFVNVMETIHKIADVQKRILKKLEKIK